MTYLEFLLLFVGIPLVGLFLVAHRKRDWIDLTSLGLL